MLSLPVLFMLIEMLILEAFFTNGIWAGVSTTSSVGSQEDSPGCLSIFASGHGGC